MPNNSLLPLLLKVGAAHAHSKTPQPHNGDILRVNRGLYSHYGVYAEPGHVIHYTGAAGPADFNGIVRETTLEEFLNGAKTFSICKFPQNPAIVPVVPARNTLARILNMIRVMKLRDYHLYSPEETVERARSKLGEGGYNLALNNCEHFAVWCRTGVKDSSQVNNILGIIAELIG